MSDDERVVPDDADAMVRRPNAAVKRYLAAREARKTADPERLLPVPAPEQDTLWRGLVRDGQMRLIVARAGRTVAEIAERHHCSAQAHELLAGLVVGAQLLRATINPDESLQLAGFQQGGVGNFAVDVFEDGAVRATFRNPGHRGEALVGGRLQITRQQPGRGQYRSSIAFSHGEAPGDLLMRYLLESEQILSLLEVDFAPERGQGEEADARAVVGYVVQLMPEGTREDLALLVSNLEHCGRPAAQMIDGDADAVAWASGLLRGFYWDQVARQEVRFGCPCSAERVLALLASLSPADLHDLIEGLEVIETTCEYCRTHWSTPAAQLAGLLDRPS
jgi:molecular chaperone Hsp33